MNWKSVMLAAVLGWSVLGLAQGFGPEEALRYQDPRVSALQSMVDARVGATQVAELGFGARVMMESFFLPQRGFDREETYFNIGWSRKPERLARAYRDLEQARSGLADARVEGTRQALTVHARLLRAQERVRQFEARARQAQLRLQEAQQRSGISVVDLERIRGGAAGTQLDLDNARLELRSLQDTAARYSLQGAAQPRVVKFALPEATVDTFPAYRLALARLRHTEAEALETNLSFLNKVRVDTSFAGKDLDVRAGVEFTDAGFGANTSFHPGDPNLSNLNNPTVGLSLRLEIPIDFAYFGNSAAANAAVQLERQGLQGLRDDLIRRYAFLRESIALAERGLDLNLTSSTAERGRFQAAEADFRADRLPEADWLSRQADYRADEDLSRAWEEYFNRVSDYLELVGGVWRVR